MKKNYHGGILLTALLLVMLFSFVFQLVVEEAQLTNRFSIKTQHFYSAKIIYNMFCIEVEQKNQLTSQNGTINYSEGMLLYKIEDDYIITDILVHQKKYQFNKIKIGKKRIKNYST